MRLRRVISTLALLAGVSVIVSCRDNDITSIRELGPIMMSVVPMEAPDSMPDSLLAPSRWVANSARISGQFARDLVLVRFTDGATQMQRQDAIDLINGTIAGGLPFVGMEGVYYVQLPADSTNEAVFSAIATLQGLSQVEDALPELITDDAFSYRRPSDGTGMLRTDWQLNPDSAFGRPGRTTWAFEAVNAPYAWGCAVGDTSVRIAVLDAGLRPSGGIASNVVDTSRMSTSGFSHGIAVASVLAARRDDNAGTTGMMWKARLQLYGIEDNPASATPRPSIARIGQQITRALANDARVINISLGVGQANTNSPTAAHDTARALVGRLFRNAVVNSGASRPVIVLAAGNAGNATDVYWSVYAAVADYLPNETIIVTGG